MLEEVFETAREQVSICDIGSDGIPSSTSAHIFAVCVTSDGKPVVGVRRTSFAYQAVTARRKASPVTQVSRALLKYMYSNEVKEILIRLVTPCPQGVADSGTVFEELVMLGGSPLKNESAHECLAREVQEESDAKLTVVGFGARALKISIYDKILEKRYAGYCMLCFVAESARDIERATLYNIEVRSICPLEKKKNNEKYEYLSYIYNTLTPTK